MFYFCQIHLVFHIYDHLDIPCLAIIFIFPNACEVLSDSHKHVTLDKYIFSFTFFINEVFLVWQSYLFFLIYSNNLKLYTQGYLYTMLMP